MSRKSKMISVLAVITMTALACAIPGGILPSSIPSNLPVDIIGTTVAGTLTAMPPLFQQPTSTGVGSEAEATPTLGAPAPAVLRVAYVKNKDAWIWTQGGSPIQLSANGDILDVAISSDGQQVAYIRQTGEFVQEIWAVNKDGSNPRTLVSGNELLATYSGAAADQPNGIGVFQFGWQPGSHNLYYNTKPLVAGPGSMSYNDLYRVNTDNLAKTTLFGAGQGGKFVFSPDGTKMAIVTSTAISLANADGSNLHSNVVTYPNVITYSEYNYYPNPVWATDGSQLKAVVPSADPMANPLPPSTLWSAPGDGGAGTATGGVQAIAFAWPDYAISPDLKKLGYAQPVGAPADNTTQLHLVFSDLSGDHVFASGTSLRFVGWLPNSNQFVYTIGSGAGVGIYIGNLDGSQVQLSAVPNLFLGMVWTDNTHFLYRTPINNGSAFELRYFDLSGMTSILIDSGEVWVFDFSH